MDETLRRLEREFALHPDNSNLAKRIAHNYHRTGWTLEGLTLEQWIARIDSENNSERLHAARRLAQLGHIAHEALPNLLKLLSRPADADRSAAVCALEHIATIDFLPNILELLEKNSGPSLVPVLEALGAVGNESHDAFQAVLDRLSHNNRFVAATATHTLRQFPRFAKEALPLLLRSCHSAVRAVAISSLYNLGTLPYEPKEVLSKLMLMLDNVEPEIQNAAIWSLGELGYHSHKARPVLYRIMERGDGEGRAESSYVLGEIGAESPAALRALSLTLKDEHTAARRNTASVLKDLYPLLEDAQELFDASQDFDPVVRRRTRQILADLSLPISSQAPKRPPAPSHEDELAVQQSREDLEEDPVSPSLYALRVTRRLGEKAIGLLPTLLWCLDSTPDADLKYYLLDSIGHLGCTADEALPFVEGYLEDHNLELRLAATRTVQRIANLEVKNHSLLLNRLSDESRACQGLACTALQSLGTTLIIEAIEGLVPLLANTDRHLRMSAIECLGEGPMPAKDLLRPLLSMMRDPNPKVRWLTARALGRLTPAESKPRMVLIEALEDDSLNVKAHALTALARLGEKSSAALNKIDALRKHPNDSLSYRAIAVWQYLKA